MAKNDTTSVRHADKEAHTHTHPPINPPTLTLSRTLVRTPRTYSLRHTLSHTHTPFSPTHTHTHTHTHCLSLTPTHTHPSPLPHPHSDVPPATIGTFSAPSLLTILVLLCMHDLSHSVQGLSGHCGSPRTIFMPTHGTVLQINRRKGREGRREGKREGGNMSVG